MYVTINDEGSLEVYTEENDICYICSNMDACPLMASLQCEIAILRYDSLNVEDCGLFKEFSIDDLIADLAS
ncbi:MAG: hypothetical protein A2104_01250 [Candidatus Melainabacteria bacterium GWF2_32_7]|nr:MAG: hypothetical protein A2104_01250 [Candidatus Melainabacteria bacterium GWF2_32_7]